MQISRQFKLIFTILTLLFCTSVVSAQDDKPEGGGDAAKGKQLFNDNCGTCHNPTDQASVGPGLKGVSDKRDRQWLYKWIKNSSEFIESGDKDAKAIYEEYNKVQMTAFPTFSNENIDDVLAYIDSYVPPVEEKAEAGTDGEAAGDQKSNSIITILLGSLLTILVVLLFILIFITSLLTKFVKQSSNLSDDEISEIDEGKFDISKIFRSKAFLAIIGVFFFLVIAKAGMDKVANIGIQIGYAPEQPIAFSHKLHVGANEIECAYCHTGVYKGKTANIPSLNICMNCHNQIKRTSPEIQKIYKAIEKNKPIEWVRVHNLPDLVYFNHSQHTVAGELDCTNCHGDVQEMEVMQQRSPLTMGWCIDCHRETVVKGAGDESNKYYDRLRKAHARDGLKATDIKVKDIGGLECSKCHY